MKMIDADAIYKILESCEIRKATIGDPLTDWEYGYTCGIERAESEIECAPTVDAVPVIRCKDCKYYQKGHHSDDWLWCMMNHHYTDEEKHCAWAERKEK